MKILNQRDGSSGLFWRVNQRDGSFGLFWRVNQRDGFGLQKKKCSRSPQPAAFQRRIKKWWSWGTPTPTYQNKQMSV